MSIGLKGMILHRRPHSRPSGNTCCMHMHYTHTHTRLFPSQNLQALGSLSSLSRSSTLATNNISTKWLVPGPGTRTEVSFQLSSLEFTLHSDTPGLSQCFKASKKGGQWDEFFGVPCFIPNHLTTPCADSQLLCQDPNLQVKSPLKTSLPWKKITAHPHGPLAIQVNRPLSSSI